MLSGGAMTGRGPMGPAILLMVVERPLTPPTPPVPAPSLEAVPMVDDAAHDVYAIVGVIVIERAVALAKHIPRGTGRAGRGPCLGPTGRCQASTYLAK